MKFKPGVTSEGLTADMREALPLIENAFQHYDQEPTITSTVKDYNKHLPNSKHYTGNAVDIRTRDLNPILRGMIFQKLKSELGPYFAVLFEDDVIKNGEYKKRQHFHIQFNSQPKAA